jgi:hypothetical protein
MKNLTLLLTLMIGISMNSYSQTYYNPTNSVDLTITIRESFKPVDFGKIGRDFNTMIQNELQRRENLKRYYDEIYFQTKNSVYSSTVLTSDNLVNSKILMVQSEVISYLDLINRSLKNGIMKPEDYESKVRNIFYSFMNINQQFLQIINYNYNKELELRDQLKIDEHRNKFNETLNGIVNFRINDVHDINFILENFVYSETKKLNTDFGFVYLNPVDSLHMFVKSSCEGKFEDYKIKWKSVENEIEKEKNKELELLNDWKKFRDETLEIRKNKLLSIKDSNKESDIRKNEYDYFIYMLKKLKKDDPEFKKINPKMVWGYWMKEKDYELFELKKVYENGSDVINSYNAKVFISIVRNFWDLY